MISKTILVAPDKFKFSLTAAEFCKIAQDVANRYPGVRVISCPLADGGEGTIECFLRANGGDKITIAVTGPNFKKIQAEYALSGRTACIEIAKAAGLGVAKTKNPLITTTLGVGELILHALDSHVKKIYIGLGGSATNDAGCGMAAALGFKFFDKNNIEFIPTGETLKNIQKITQPDASMLKKLKSVKFVALYDVNNPLFGPNGAAYTYAKQKGAAKIQIEQLDQGLRHFNEIAKKYGCDFENMRAAGAAGGLSAGCKLFLKAQIKSGIRAFFKMHNINKKIRSSDVIITGEGKVDAQSAQGKVCLSLAKACKKARKPVWIFCGTNQLQDYHRFGIKQIVSINRPNEDFVTSLKNTPKNLELCLKKYFDEILE